MTAPTLSSADEDIDVGTSVLPPPLPPLRGVMTRLCFSRICFILAARRRREEEVVEAAEAVDMLGTLCIVEVNQSEQWSEASKRYEGRLCKSSQASSVKPMRPFELTSNSISTPRNNATKHTDPTELNSTPPMVCFTWCCCVAVGSQQRKE